MTDLPKRAITTPTVSKMNQEEDEKDITEMLLPCPFCGEEAFVWTAIQGTKVSCSKDCVTMPPRFDMFFTSIEEAVKHWNRRTLREKEGEKWEIDIF